MDDADGDEEEHAAKEESAAMAGQDEREADSEQQGEDSVELAVNEEILQEADDAVHRGRRHGGLLLGREEGPEGKFGIVGQGDAHERQPSQEVEDEVALALGGWSLWLHIRGQNYDFSVEKPSLFPLFYGIAMQDFRCTNVL